MRVMVLVKATVDSEQGVMPSTELLEAMGHFNEERAAAGVMKAGEGLKPTSRGCRVVFDSTTREVRQGPFEPVGEQLAGFWIWEVRDLDQAIDWVRRCPNPMPGRSEIEIRPVYELEDFGDAVSPELAESERRLREQTGG